VRLICNTWQRIEFVVRPTSYAQQKPSQPHAHAPYTLSPTSQPHVQVHMHAPHTPGPTSQAPEAAAGRANPTHTPSYPCEQLPPPSSLIADPCRQKPPLHMARVGAPWPGPVLPRLPSPARAGRSSPPQIGAWAGAVAGPRWQGPHRRSSAARGRRGRLPAMETLDLVAYASSGGGGARSCD
jgi:hypothetical protein